MMPHSLDPLVSILMPAYNAARHIAQALDSVLSQSYPRIEIVVVDDGSTDGTRDVLADYEHRGVRVLRQANAGQCAAANRAFAASEGDLIKFFDADDVLDPEHVALQVRRLQGRPDAVAMAEWARFYGEDPSEARFGSLPMYRDARPIDWLVDEWMDARPMMQCAIWLIPRPILLRSGLWDEELSLINDFEFFTRVLLAADQLLYVAGARLRYRSGHSGTLSQRKDRAAAESGLSSLLKGTGALLSRDDSARARLACANLMLDYDYTFFPDYPDLRARARRRARELGGGELAPDGPPRFQRLRKWVGWRLARRVQLLGDRMRGRLG